MDSLTQIVLGAACGEAVLGKKIGNKALLYGAIGGTIPDLDVFVGSWLHGNEIDAMLFHRGPMHSILFCVVAAFPLGWLCYKFYEYRKASRVLIWIYEGFGRFWLTKFLHRAFRRYQNEMKTTSRDWILLFFWSLFTHPILDAFTPYGTQLFAPFSNYRVAFNNIAVADPAYTLPFLTCMIVLMFFKRISKKRRLWLKWGIGISSVYLVLTMGNKLYIDSVFRKSMHEANIEALRFTTQPAILNNVLWYAIAETESSYFVADYSLMDTKNRFLNFREVPKRRDLKAADYQGVKNLAWFSNWYYTIYELENGEYHYNDMRYPLLDEDDPNSSVFSFILYMDGDRLNMKPFDRNVDNIGEIIISLWERTKGI